MSSAKPAVRRRSARSAAPGRHPPLAARVKSYREAYGLTQPLIGRLTGFSTRSVAALADGSEPSPRQAKAFAETDRLLVALGKVMGAAAVGGWLRKPNRAFDGSTPLQAIERGEADRVWRMIYDLEAGEPS